MAHRSTSRVALITYTSSGGDHFVGSGLLVNDHVILTADHVAHGSEHVVTCLGQSWPVVETVRSGTPHVDLALLLIAPIPGVEQLPLACIGRVEIGLIEDCVAVGFPRWKRIGGRRRSAQVDGAIPTADNLIEDIGNSLQVGWLTLVGNRVPEPPIASGPTGDGATQQPWGGMSGAVVLVGDAVVGVVRSVNHAEDGKSLTVEPLTAIDSLNQYRAEQYWLHLGGRNLRTISPRSATAPASGGYRYDVFISYHDQGTVAPWVRRRFKEDFVNSLADELGRRPIVLLGPDSSQTDEALITSRVLLAVLAKSYFFMPPCLSQFDSMVQRQRQAADGPTLVHAIIAHDHASEDYVPLEYHGTYDPIDFKPWAHDRYIRDWQIFSEYNGAMRSLADAVAQSIEAVPAWSPQFPITRPTAGPLPFQRRPEL